MQSEELDEQAVLFQEAADWLLTLKNTPEGSTALGEFQVWVATSDEHRRVWNKVNETWSMLGAGSSLREPESKAGPHTARLRRHATGRASPHAPAAPRGRFRRTATAGMALAVLCAVLLAAPNLMLTMRADYRTSSGETEKIRLVDGSTVELGGGSAISTNVTADNRQVALLAGEAFFDIASDVARPFVVDVRGLELKVLGTAFDVRVTSDSTTVALLHGSVQIDPVSDGPTRVLSPGQMLELDHGTGEVSIQPVSPEDIGAWRDGKVFVANVTVGAVVEMIQRYHTAWISMPDAGLASNKVSGLFDLRDPDAALVALVRPFGGKVRSVTPLARVITRL